MATTMSDLPLDMVREILYRVSLTSLSAVQCTCKTWNALSKIHIFGAEKQFMGFMVMDSKLCSMDFLGDLVEPSIKQARILNQAAEICKVFHCDGLLLCVIKDKRWLVVWNPYLGQIRWIQPIKKSHKFHPTDMYALGYDNERSHKILRLLDEFKYSHDLQIYNFDSNSWRVLHVNPGCEIRSCVSLKGNAYFLAQRLSTDASMVYHFLLCFDFTTERFGSRLILPFATSIKTVTLSCVRDEKLAVLYQTNNQMMEIWITNKIKPNAASWSRFLRVKMRPSAFVVGNFFIDQEKKVAVVSELCKYFPTNACPYQLAYIFGEHGFLKSVNIGGARKPGHSYYI